MFSKKKMKTKINRQKKKRIKKRYKKNKETKENNFLDKF